MSTRMVGRWSLAGIRAPAASKADGCVVCRGTGAPALLLMSATGSRELLPVARLCLPCVARAVEGATGWKVMRAWAQWLASSLHAQTHRTNKETDNG
jgi:hypothetical protein